MKVIPLLSMLALPLAVAAADIRPGDSLAEVRAALGAPRGQVRQQDRLLLYYDRGDVVVRSGVVTEVALVSESEYAANEARRAAAAERGRLDAANLTVTGEEIMARQLASAAFRSTPAAYQVAYWQNFSRRYPGVNCTEALLAAQASLAIAFAEQRKRAEQEERLAEIAARLAAVEARGSDYASNDFSPRGSYPYYRGYYPVSDTYWPIYYQLTDDGYVAHLSDQPVSSRYGRDSFRSGRSFGHGTGGRGRF